MKTANGGRAPVVGFSFWTAVWLVFSSSVIFIPHLLETAVSRIAAALSTLGIGGIASRLGFSGSTLSGRPGQSDGGTRAPSAKDRIGNFAGPLFLIMLIGVLGILNARLLFPCRTGRPGCLVLRSDSIPSFT